MRDEAPKRRRWWMKRGAEMKKQGAMPTLQGRQCDCVSEGVSFCEAKDGGRDLHFVCAKSSLLQSYGQLPHQRKPKTEGKITEQNLERSGNLKKIIAAALSILVGTFGYNIVDKAIEDRVASLESEVIELREEVSRHHPQYSEQITTAPASESTTRNRETTIYNPTTGDFVDPTQPLAIGSYLKESSGSLHKFLIREYTNGRFSYIPYYNYKPISSTTTKPITTKPTTTKPNTSRLTTTPDSFILTTNISEGILGLLSTTNVFTTSLYDDPVDNFLTTNNAAPVAEYYINITESSAEITNITEEVSYKYSYDKDYSLVSNPNIQKTIFVTVFCEGYTDSALSGKKIIIETMIDEYYQDISIPKEIISNTINSDGSFEYKAIYSTMYPIDSIDTYSFTSIQIAK